MEFPMMLALAAVALIWFNARPKLRRARRDSSTPKFWESTQRTASFSWYGVSGGGDAGASYHGPGHSHHHGGNDGSTNVAAVILVPAITGGFDSGGGGDVGGGDGGH